MNRIMWLACLGLMFTQGCPCPCPAEGVDTVERVIELPKDQDKWYLSVVGSCKDAHYHRLLRWFDTNTELETFRSQVHYRKVTTGSAIYRARYAPNVKGLPTVRLQQANGVVVYEAHGENIPATPNRLYNAMTMASQFRKLCPNLCRPKPKPTPKPPVIDAEPLVVEEPSVVEQPYFLGLQASIALACAIFLAGTAVGFGVQWYNTHHKPI